MTEENSVMNAAAELFVSPLIEGKCGGTSQEKRVCFGRFHLLPVCLTQNTPEQDPVHLRADEQTDGPFTTKHGQADSR